MINTEKISFGKVAVMLGGNSSEREISLQSGKTVFNALCQQGVDAHLIDPAKDLRILQDGKFDRVFIALHGRGGEDGLIQGMLETLNLPYTGSGVLGSALSMDKCCSKYTWQAHKLPTAKFSELHEHSDWNHVAHSLGLPLMVKPSREGSSYGISKVSVVSEMERAWQYAKQYDDRVIAEAWVSGHEYTVPILHNAALPIIRLETPRVFYDYEAKYIADTTKYHCPSGLNASVEKEFAELALNAFHALHCNGWGRVDLITDEDGKPWLIEANTVPGMTDHSLVPIAAKYKGLDFNDLTIQILATSL